MNAPLTLRGSRLDAAAQLDAGVAVRLDGYLALAARGLVAAYDPERQCFPHTVRADPTSDSGIRPVGTSERYTAMAALGLSRLTADDQRAVLAGSTAAELAGAVDTRAADASEFGAKALAAWSADETGAGASDRLLEQLTVEMASLRPRATVEHAWALTAFVGAQARLGAEPARAAAEGLLASQWPSGIFPHSTTPPRRTGRAHVGCFADQVYPVQALARYHALTGDPRALAAAERCARAIVQAQGADGQWWWHYDIRTGGVVEGYPVYSVHQHAMAPMALLELGEAGGDGHLAAVLRGVSWLEQHPDSDLELVCPERAVIWRKVRRREPSHAARRFRAAATARTPQVRSAWLDRVLPPGPVDHECRPYELGWLLYAWLSGPARPSDVPRSNAEGKAHHVR